MHILREARPFVRTRQGQAQHEHTLFRIWYHELVASHSWRDATSVYASVVRRSLRADTPRERGMLRRDARRAAVKSVPTSAPHATGFAPKGAARIMQRVSRHGKRGVSRGRGPSRPRPTALLPRSFAPSPPPPTPVDHAAGPPSTALCLRRSRWAAQGRRAVPMRRIASQQQAAPRRADAARRLPAAIMARRFGGAQGGGAAAARAATSSSPRARSRGTSGRTC